MEEQAPGGASGSGSYEPSDAGSGAEDDAIHSAFATLEEDGESEYSLTPSEQATPSDAEPRANGTEEAEALAPGQMAAAVVPPLVDGTTGAGRRRPTQGKAVPAPTMLQHGPGSVPHPPPAG